MKKGAPNTEMCPLINHPAPPAEGAEVGWVSLRFALPGGGTAVERSLKIQTMKSTTRAVYLANHTCTTLYDDISASRNFSW